MLAAASGGWWGGPPDRRGIPSADCPDGHAERLPRAEVEGSRYTTRFVPAAGKAAGHLRAMVHGPHYRHLRSAERLDPA